MCGSHVVIEIKTPKSLVIGTTSDLLGGSNLLHRAVNFFRSPRSVQSAPGKSLAKGWMTWLNRPMYFAVLGPLEVRRDGRSLSLGGPKQRAILAMLLLEANRPLSKERLTDGVWGEQPPSSASETLDAYIYRLRKLLGPDRLTRRPGGYLLRLEADELDLIVFEELVSQAEQQLLINPAAAAAKLRQALGLWRGAALADLSYEPFAAGLTDQLEELRLAAVERRLEAELATGLGLELVAELEQLARDHPTRERIVAHLMLALYRAGRQVDALAAMQICRRRLAEEVGIEPGPELRQLEQRILQHDEQLVPRLPPVVPEPATADPAGPSRHPGRQQTRWALPAAVLLVMAVVATVWATSPQASPAGAIPANELVAIGDRSGEPMSRIALPAQPGAMAVADGSVWVASPSGGAVLQVDPAKDTVVDTIPVGGEPGSLVTGGGALWVASTIGATVERIDPGSGTVTWTAHLHQANPVSMAFGDGGLWVADSTDQALLELSPLSGSLLRRFSLDLRPTAIAYGDGLIWVAAYDTGTVEGIDPTTGQTIGAGGRRRRPRIPGFRSRQALGGKQPRRHGLGRRHGELYRGRHHRHGQRAGVRVGEQRCHLGREPVLRDSVADKPAATSGRRHRPSR